MKKFIALILVALFTLSTFSIANANDYLPYVEKPTQLTYQPDNVTLNIMGRTSRAFNVVYCNGRLCVPLYDTITAMDGTYSLVNDDCKITISGKTIDISTKTKDSNRVVTCYYNNICYISLYELLTPFDYIATVDIGANKVNILKHSTNMPNSQLAKTTATKSAYIRLEDIVADGMDTTAEPNYTIENLEKLRYTAEYLYTKGEQYYIAWVPVYSNPATKTWNDVSVTFNLYNAYFVYTLDYMVDHGGHIGLHGYTHQYGKDKSCVGYEWGSKTPYTRQQQMQRMIYAKETCHRLGYKEEFFEFPHYGATKDQLRIAENYFDVIYQSYPKQELINQLTYTTESSKKVYYVPTPADYVHHLGDLNGILGRLNNSMENNYTMSLFYHPVLDIKKITTYTTADGIRLWYYSDQGMLPNIIEYMNSHNYKFDKIKED